MIKAFIVGKINTPINFDYAKSEAHKRYVRSFVEKKYQETESASTKFFRECPYSYTGNRNCKSNSWNPVSGCWKCFEEGKYDCKNGKLITADMFIEEAKKCR